MNENHKNMHRLYNYTVINNNFSFFGFLLINLPVPSCPQTFHHRKGKSTSKYSRLLEKRDAWTSWTHFRFSHTNSSWSFLNIPEFNNQSIKFFFRSLGKCQSEDRLECVSVHLTWLSKLFHDTVVIIKNNLTEKELKLSVLNVI